ncbi:MAG: hypothetical protein ACLFNT_04530 [Spirochaetales bacterium]
MSGLGSGLVYIVLALIEVLGGSPEFDADYLQAGVPVAVLEVREVPDPERDLFTLTARPGEGRQESPGLSANALDESVTYRIEESDLIASNYLVYPPGVAVPGVAPLAPILSQLGPGRDRPSSIGAPPLVLTLDSDVDFSIGGDDQSELSGSLLVLYRGPYLIVSAPELELLLIVEPRDE